MTEQTLVGGDADGGALDLAAGRLTPQLPRELAHLRDRLRPAKDFADLVYLTQVNQAEAIRIAALHHRACRPVTMGSLYWQLNDVWPSISWASIDHDGQWKLLNYAARRFFAPQAIAAEHKDGATRISLISDATTPIAARWRVRAALGYEPDTVMPEAYLLDGATLRVRCAPGVVIATIWDDR